MKIVLVQFLLVLLNISQVIAADFEQNNVVIFDNWGGNVSQFKIDKPLNAIQLNGNLANKEAAIFFKNTMNSGVWSFRCKMEFNPSSQNYCEVFLCSSDTVVANASGYSVVIGKNTDRIELVRHINGTATTILKSVDNFLNIATVDVFITVERNDLGQWSLSADLGKGSELIGSVDDMYLNNTNYFIIDCVYTSTRSTKFTFSQFNCEGKTIVPEVMVDTKIAKHDLLFTEFMPDPSPAVNLPEVEYLEIYNRTDKAIFIGALSLQLGANEYLLPTDSILPHQYITLTTETGAAQFPAKGKVLGMKSFPLLSNSGFTLSIINNENLVVDNFVYNPANYSGKKADGGWALERKSNLDLALSVTNWDFATSLDGGTPSTQNSISSTDLVISPANMTNISYLTDSTFLVNFSKQMSSINSVLRWVTTPLSVIEKARFLDSLYTTMQITLKAPIDTNIVYRVDSLCNFWDANDKQTTIASTQKFGKPITPQRGSLWINEVLFDASQDGGEFVELYNTSSRIMETTYLRLQYNDAPLLKLSELPLSIPPNGYCLLSKSYYSSQNFKNLPENCTLLAISNFPQLSNEAGNIALKLSDGSVIDSIRYASSMHHPAIINTKDVSLERSSYTKDSASSCFKSASSSVQYSTPGLKNSCGPNSYSTEISGAISFPSDYFSPNNDGTLDRFEMVRGDGYADAIVTVKIFSINGILLNVITENSLLQPSDILYWDGLDEYNKLMEPGFYVVLCTGYTALGETFTVKKAVILAPK